MSRFLYVHSFFRQERRDKSERVAKSNIKEYET